MTNIVKLMRCRRNILLLLLAVIAAFDISAQGRWWGYYTPDDKREALGLGVGDTYLYAMQVPANSSTLSGSVVKGVSFYLRDPGNISEVKVWLSKRLPEKASYADVACYDVDLSTLKGGDTQEMPGIRNEFTLPQSYTITEKGVYVGISVRIDDASNDAGKFPVVLSRQPEPLEGGLFIRTANSILAWQDGYDRGYGNSTLGILVEGSNIRKNAASVSPAIESETAAIENTSDIYVELTNEGEAGIRSLDYTVSDMSGTTLYTKHLDLKEPVLGVGTKKYVYIPVEGGSSAGASNYVINLDKVNGEANESVNVRNAQFRLFTIAKAHPKHTVVEEYTGLWCPNCPRGIVGMKHLEQEYPDHFIGIAVHHGDAMEILGTSAYEEVDGYPSCRINRALTTDPYHGTQGTEDAPYGVWMDFEREQRKVPVAGIETAATWKSDKTEIDIKTDITFEYDSDKDEYGVAYALTCDGMYNSQWLQSNKYYNNAVYADDPLFDIFIKTRGPVAGLQYDHVAVAVKGINYGVRDSVTLPIVCGQTQTHETYMDISQNRLIQKKENLHLVAMLIDRASGRIVNAAKTVIGGSSSGIDEVSSATDGTEVHYSTDGRIIDKATPGIHIVRKTDGTVRKLIVR